MIQYKAVSMQRPQKLLAPWISSATTVWRMLTPSTVVRRWRRS